MTSPTPTPSCLGEREAVARAERVTLAECPVGLFLADSGALCLKTEYGNNEGRIDAYIVESGEFFWGVSPQTIASQRRQMVRPVSAPLRTENETLRAEKARGHRYRDKMLVQIETLRAEVAKLRQLNADYEEVLADKRRLAREIDVAMHGEEGAAKVPSLCDLIEPARTLRAERDEAREVVAFCNNSFGSYSYHLNPHPAWQIEKVKEQARSEWQRAEAAETQLVTLRVERDAAIARAEEAERLNVEIAAAYLVVVGTAESEELRAVTALGTVSDLTAKLAQAEGEIATMRAALDNSQSLLVMIREIAPTDAGWREEGVPALLQDQISSNRAALTTPEHPHGD